MVAREEGKRVIAKAGGYGSAADRTCVLVSVIFLTFALRLVFREISFIPNRTP
jgi:hypothetical protein